jgi:thiamine biosynthesis lipoprotein
MPSSSPGNQRSKPLFGTFVTVRVHGLAPAETQQLIERCFAEATDIHRLMSFQEPGSEVSRLNRQAHGSPVKVDPRTYEVLCRATEVSRQSAGVFDVTVAPQAVACGASAAPQGAPSPDPEARWSDIELLAEEHVRFARPLWIDLSGIAKGYAVDRLIDLIATSSPTHASVNAGGDLRVLGEESEWIRVDAGGDRAQVPLVELRNDSIASSGHRFLSSSRECAVAHIDGVGRQETPVRFASVLASTCTLADALTKVVMARGTAAEPVLRAFAARALMREAVNGWQELA